MEDWARHDKLDGPPSGILGSTAVLVLENLHWLRHPQSSKYTATLRQASFFFRANLMRNNRGYLIPTLAYQLVQSFRAIPPFVEDRHVRIWSCSRRVVEFKCRSFA